MTLHRAAAVAVLALTVSACGGGGGGGGIQTAAPVTPAPVTPAPVTPAPVTPAPVTPAPVTPAVTISITGPNSVGVNGVTSPAFNFLGSPPPNGTMFSLGGPAIRSTSNGIATAGLPGNDVNAILRGTVTTNGVSYPVFDFSIASLGVSATNVRGDGTDVNLPGGGKVSAVIATLNYTFLGAWFYNAPGSGPAYLGEFVNGYLTPNASLPVSGSATYVGSGATGGVLGTYFIPGGNNTIVGGVLSGDVNMNVHFGTNGVTGQFTNMTAKPTGQAAVPWNNVTLNGSILRSAGGNTASGTTSANPAPGGAGSIGFGTAATGNFAGTFYGPAHNEMGGTFTLSESTPDGGRTAFGSFVGAR